MHRTILGALIPEPDPDPRPLASGPRDVLHRTVHFTRFILASFGLHILLIATALLLAQRADLSLPAITPVNIVDLPQNMLRNLPPVNARPMPESRPAEPRLPPHAFPDMPARPESLPGPKHPGTAPDISLPRTSPPPGLPEGSDKGTADKGLPDTGARTAPKGPLPFLSQADIEEYARKGMPAKKPGDNSVTLDTDEFKFLSYNRWLKVHVERVLKYPELAALSGLQGTLYIYFDIMKDGSLDNLELIKSSGYKILDDEALRAIRQAAPFQPLPDEWHMDHYSIRAAVLFYLNEAYIR